MLRHLTVMVTAKLGASDVQSHIVDVGRVCHVEREHLVGVFFNICGHIQGLPIPNQPV